MRRSPSAVQLAYLDNLVALAASAAPTDPAPCAEPAASSVSERSVAAPPRRLLIRPVRIPLGWRPGSEARSALRWLVAAALVLATLHGCSAAFAHDRVVPKARPHATSSPKQREGERLPPPQPAVPAPADPALPAVVEPPAPSPAPIAVPPAPEPAITPLAAPPATLPDSLHRAGDPRIGRVWALLAAAGASLVAASVVVVVVGAGMRRRSGVAVAEPSPPAPAEGAWTVGFATEKGHVRGHNEDAGAAFQLGADRVAIVADGLGGMPEGAAASAVAVRAAERFMRHCVRRADPARRPAPSILLHGAFAAASAALAREGFRRGFTRREDGLRTTLLIAIAAEGEYHFGYSGDGGMFAIAADGAVRSLMTPQKVEGAAPNVIGGSLGPLPHGAPVFGQAERVPGDLLAVVSDGVADRLPLQFYGHDRGLKHYLHLCGGDLATGAARTLTMLARELDDGLYRFDDNMTLALIGDGPAAPVLAPAVHLAEAA